MDLKLYIRIWLIFAITLSYEYWALNFHTSLSLLAHLGFKASPDPGGRLGLVLGWLGISVMLLTNLYILRKRMDLLKGVGKLSAWLDFHIFCGLLGPTFILFHCNFKVRGLVAISFWSMVVAVASGVVGRYFYVQLLGLKKESKEDAHFWGQELALMQREATTPIPDESMFKLKKKALAYVGVSPETVGSDGSIRLNAMQVLFSALAGDFRLIVDLPKTIAGLPMKSRVILKRYALAERKVLFLEPFRHLMGHWHTFHTPFAIFMYLAAIIHIGAALVLGVTK